MTAREIAEIAEGNGFAWIMPYVTTYGDEQRQAGIRQAAEASWCNGCKQRVLALLDAPPEEER